MKFANKSEKLAALDDLRSAYATARAELDALARSIPLKQRTDAQTRVIRELPCWLSQWTAEHRATVLDAFPQAVALCDKIDLLKSQHNAVKKAKVARTIREVEADPREDRIKSAIRQMLSERDTSYAFGLDISHLFGGLPVTANALLVPNRHGAPFLRAFFFLGGVLTPLSMIPDRDA